ncbi:MAG: glutaredoxin domain-containing protein [Acidobacteriota bacterium]
MILVYVADGCPFCELLLADLQKRRVSFVAVNLSREPERIGELARWTFERAVPVVVDHERCSVGFRGQSTELAALGL